MEVLSWIGLKLLNALFSAFGVGFAWWLAKYLTSPLGANIYPDPTRVGPTSIVSASYGLACGALAYWFYLAERGFDVRVGFIGAVTTAAAFFFLDAHGMQYTTKQIHKLSGVKARNERLKVVLKARADKISELKARNEEFEALKKARGIKITRLKARHERLEVLAKVREEFPWVTVEDEPDLLRSLDDYIHAERDDISRELSDC